VPLWIRPENATAKPIMSHDAASNNIVLKIDVPRRTGRKRKRGSEGPFSGDLDMPAASPEPSPDRPVGSFGRQDRPDDLLRRLRDNMTKYKVEALGIIKSTHRYRGLSDFQFITSDFPFLANVADHLLHMKGV
jgi:general transcription factor 3C polypeptide 5 (transcription factor C subunit 1)